MVSLRHIIEKALNMDKSRQISDWIAQELAGELSKENHDLLMKWVNKNQENQAFYNETIKLWTVAENYSEPFDTNLDNAWNQFENKLNKIEKATASTAKVIDIPQVQTKSEAKTGVLFSLKNVLKIASVFLIGGLGFWLLQNVGNAEQNFVSYNTAADQTKEITLPDNSKVVLNENSMLAYVEKDGKRNVELSGEAWFDVVHDTEHPFEILSGETQTVVLGTAFNVRAYPKEANVEVTVERGKVAFAEKANTANKTLLPAGTEGIFYKKEKKVEQVKKIANEVNNVSAWRTKQLVFDDLPMQTIIESLERYYKVNIETETPELLNCTWRGTYKDYKLDVIMELFSAGFDNAKWENKNGTYWISGTCPQEVN